MGDAAAQMPGIGWESLALSFASLGVVCVLAWGTLRLLAGRGIGKASGAIRVVARCPLEPRRSVYVIETAGRCFLVGVGDGPMALLAELDADKLPRRPSRRRRGSPTCWRACWARPRRQEPPRRRSSRYEAAVAVGRVLVAPFPRRARGGRARHAASTRAWPRPLVLMLAMAALSLIPFALLMVTSFVRISVVLSILRSAIGTPSVPPTQVLTGLALVLTLAVMAPTGERMYDAMSRAWARPPAPTLASAETRRRRWATAADRAQGAAARVPAQAHRPRDRASFLAVTLKMRAPEERAGVTDRDFGVIVPAFVTSELRRAFQIGFLLFIPFLVIDMVIANLLLALGMHMLSPTTVSLPFKLLLFVLADGWHAGRSAAWSRATL